jgi:hypothetical protein
MPQFFAAQSATRAYAGRTSPQGPANNWSLNNGIGFSKILPTGALLLLNFTNQTVFDFVNPKHTLSVSNLNFDAIQPLLRGGGEAVALESLTQAERNLLYAIRNFARFRKELYVEIASQSGGSISGSTFQPSGVLSNNGVGGNAGLGASGIIPGAIAPVATSILSPLVAPNSPGTLALAPAITPPPSGYLNTKKSRFTSTRKTWMCSATSCCASAGCWKATWWRRCKCNRWSNSCCRAAPPSWSIRRSTCNPWMLSSWISACRCA